jgi:hypothetical protein
VVKGVEEMAEAGLEPGRSADGQRRATLRAGQAAGPVEDRVAKGAQPLERPQRGPPGCGLAAGGRGLHLEFADQVVGQQPGQQIRLVAQPGPHRHVAHRTMGLQFRENPFLRTPPAVVDDDLLHRQRLVRYDHLEVIAVLVGNEQVQLDRSLLLRLGPSADEDEATLAVPRLGLPHLVAEEGAVHAYFDHRLRQDVANRLHAGQDELPGPVGVVDVSGAVQEIQHLSGLGQGAEQRIVTAGPFLLLVEPHGGPFGTSAGGLHRAVEVQGDAGKVELTEPLENQILQQRAEMADGGGVHLAEHSAEGGHVGQAFRAQQAFHQGLVTVAAAVAEFPEAQKEMEDQLEENAGPAEDLAHAQVPEAAVQSGLELHDGEEMLKEDQPGEGSEGVGLETDIGDGVVFTADIGSARLHEVGLLARGYLHNNPIIARQAHLSSRVGHYSAYTWAIACQKSNVVPDACFPQ